ncbi:glycosyltransferase family 4 protein [Paraburkholderia sp. PREW-6R]|uniref:glycosyltransferase family 4 protein n=1 Tax=Paraburkholderia sp. PREW-6R TaxID=3141544 RepID=UPI0031F54F84
MKLGIYCDSSVNGGHEEMLKRLVLALVKSPGIDSFHILVPAQNAAMIAFANEVAARHRHVAITSLSFTSESGQRNPLALLSTTWQTASILRKLDLTKLVIAQGTIVSAMAGLLAARLARTMAVTYIPLVDDKAEAGAPLKERIKSLVKSALYLVPNQYITLNEHLREKLLKQAAHTPVAILENYVDDRFSASTLTRESARSMLGLPQTGTFICAHIGRIHFQHKRQSFVLAAIERNPAAFANTIVLMVGDGPDADRLREAVEGSELLSRHVRIIGPKPDVLPYIVASDVVVLPSAYEGVPLVMIEAVLAGRPIVASHVSALGSYLPSELLFPVHDHDAFIEKIFAARTYPISDLTTSFRTRFSREVFDGQAQRVLLQPVPQRRVADHLEHNTSDLGTK